MTISTVSIRQFSYNPSAMFARAEKGETIEVTRHGKVIVTLVPGASKKRSRIEELEASGALRRSGKTTSDLDTFTQFDVATDVDPLKLLFEDRYGEREWELELRNELADRYGATGESV